MLYGHTRACHKTLTLTSSHSVLWVCIQTTWLILCKICPRGRKFSTARSSFAYICHKWCYIKSSQLMLPLLKGKKMPSMASLPHQCSWPHKATSVKKPFTWIYTVSHFLGFLDVFVLLFCTLRDHWQPWRGGCVSIGMRAESSLFLQADLTANPVRISNKLLLSLRGFQSFMRRCEAGGGKRTSFQLQRRSVLRDVN